jgi:uncharacterized membrane protein
MSEDKGGSRYSPAMIALVALLIALTTVFTLVLRIPTPAGGYANLSDVAITFSALLFGPWVGAVAGGVGTALADMLGGFAPFAPLSLIAHGVEGFLIGYLGWRLRSAPALLRAYSGLQASAGSTIGLEASAGLSQLRTDRLKARFRTFIALIVKHSPLILAWLAGTTAMVAIYLVGEGLFYTGWPAALAELPMNVLQGVLGAVVGIPLVLAVRRAYPAVDQLGRRRTWQE